MNPANTAAPAADFLSAEIGAFALTVLAGVIVSLVTLWLAGRQRATQERQAEARRREAVLAAIGRELRWNRVATRGKLQASNAHIMVGEGIRALGPPGTHGDEQHRKTWIDLCSQASVDISNSATQALNSLGLPVED